MNRLLLFLSIFPLVVFGETYYVDTQTGDDSRDGKVEARAFRTIAKANRILMPGDLVYIRAGIYAETIRPKRSGSPGNLITYARYGNDRVTIRNARIGIDLENRSYIRVDGVDIRSPRMYFVRISNGHHNVIRNCSMDEGLGTRWGAFSIDAGSSYNRVVANRIKKGHGDVLFVGAGTHHNLIDGNIIDGEYSTHAALQVRGKKGSPAYNNVIRNNTVRNGDDDNIALIEWVVQNLVEGNITHGAGKQAARENAQLRGAGLKFTGAHANIVRRNISVENPSSGCHLYAQYYKGINADPVTGNRIYNNVFYRNGLPGKIWINGGTSIVTYDALQAAEGNIFVNNIFAENVNQVYLGGEMAGLRDNIFRSNLFFGAKQDDVEVAGGSKAGVYSVTKIQAGQLLSPVAYFNKTVVGNPRFVGADQHDFRLQGNSGAIDKGDFLTRATRDGSGTEVPVHDATYFMNGWGVIEGDEVQFEGQARRIKIVAVDSDNNMLTLEQGADWKEGQGISLPYQSSRPDVGAFEYGQQD